MAVQQPPAIRTRRMFRGFFQAGGASPLNDLKLFGSQMGAAQVTAVMRPIRGGVKNIPVFNPNGPGYVNSGSTETAPGFPTASLAVRDSIGGLNLMATLETCPADIYIVAGTDCSVIGDHLQGYLQGYVRVLGNCVLDSGVTYGDMVSYADDTEVENTAPLAIKGVMYDHAQKFATALATANPVDLATNLTTDVVYGNQQLCANCGLPNDGTSLKYWSLASTTSSPGAKPTIIYQVRGGTPVAQQVSSAAASEDIVAIAVVGTYLVVLTRTAGGSATGGYHFATIGLTGAPGTWTKVTTGFVGGKQPNDILVLSPTEVYFAADGGYIYKSTNIANGVTVLSAGAATTNNLTRINGNRTLMVAVGVTGTIIVSYNGGANWAAAPATPPAGSPTWQSVEVVGRGFFVGSATTARMFYTPDATNWYEIIFENNNGSGTISDIYFVNNNEGYFIFNPTGQSGRIYNTYTGGNSWWNVSPAIEQLGGYTTLGRIAAPTVGNESLKSNNFIVSGTDSGTKGLLLSAQPLIF